MEWATRPGPVTDRPFMDRIYDVLARGLRRDVIRYLATHPGVTRAELEAGLVEERPIQPQHPGSTSTDRIESVLHHRDLPKLLETGVVVYDQERGEFSLSWWATDFVVPLLSLDSAVDTPPDTSPSLIE